MATEVEKLNARFEGTIIKKVLSNTGRKAYYPHEGIPGQTADARGTRINVTLGQAYDDDGRPLIIPELAEHFTLPIEEVFPYPQTFGIPELRKKWAEEIRKKTPTLEGKISLPVVTSGLANGLTLANDLFIEDGDPLVLFDPNWGNYNLHFQNANFNRVPLYDGLRLNLTDFKTNLEMEGKKIAVLTFPSNPTGYTPTLKEADELIQTCFEAASRDPLVAIIDDAYFGLTHEKGILKESLFGELANIHENLLAIKIDGMTKEAFAWGLRVGFITYAFKGMTDDVAKGLEDKTAGRIRGTISNVNRPGQYATLHALNNPNFENSVNKARGIIKGRYNLVQTLLDEHPEWSDSFSALPFNGGYYLCLDVKDVDPEIVRTTLLKSYDTGVIRTGKLLRIAYSAVPTNKIPELFDNIHSACKSLK
ncbi:MAG: aminotransferase class I/II-fold pyridoxal phosphate-dependent enzyme [Nanoarchaeota archaeon]|nr:aminotransferase class I/II-fold pyridoxal phosphate-dependent enzyme [Nanoarchaeota archaeon]